MRIRSKGLIIDSAKLRFEGGGLQLTGIPVEQDFWI